MTWAEGSCCDNLCDFCFTYVTHPISNACCGGRSFVHFILPFPATPAVYITFMLSENRTTYESKIMRLVDYMDLGRKSTYYFAGSGSFFQDEVNDTASGSVKEGANSLSALAFVEEMSKRFCRHAVKQKVATKC